VGVGKERGGGHTVGAREGQQWGQGPHPCSGEGARRGWQTNTSARGPTLSALYYDYYKPLKCGVVVLPTEIHHNKTDQGCTTLTWSLDWSHVSCPDTYTQPFPTDIWPTILIMIILLLPSTLSVRYCRCNNQLLYHLPQWTAGKDFENLSRGRQYVTTEPHLCQPRYRPCQHAHVGPVTSELASVVSNRPWITY